MSTYIPRQIRKERDRIETKLDKELIEQLELYCRYLESDRDYVIASALEIAFRKDKGFAEWLQTQQATLRENPEPSRREPQGERRGRRAGAEV